KIPRFARLLFPGNVLPEVSRIDPLRRAINSLYSPFRPRVEETLFADGNLRLVESFDSRFDDLWREASGQFTCAVARDSRFLEWMYQKQPGKKFDVAGYFDGERLLGYAIVFVRKADANG